MVSGFPLDNVTVRAAGYLPVNTRAYTFSDTKVIVKVTPVALKHTLFGYREEVPVPLPPDAGVADSGAGGAADAGSTDR